MGGNSPDAVQRLRRAVRSLRASPDPELTAVSHFYRSEPWGVPDQPAFLNAAARLQTTLPPHDLLAFLKRLEVELGRTEGPRWGPRAMDLDLLAYGSLILRTPDLAVPHPRFLERSFAFYPALELWPEWVHPETGRTLAEMSRTLLFSTASLRLRSPAPRALLKTRA
jgi:2-amino-4-hydroxy-6-hydroxymethyldihydropteridine diphosphokinase